MGEKKRMALEDIIGIADAPKIDGRFQEVISVQKIIDTENNKEYDGVVDSEFLNEINRICKENEHLKGHLKPEGELNYLNNTQMELCFKRKCFVDKTIRVIKEKYEEINSIYKLGVKKGLPTGAFYCELDLIERIADEIGISLLEAD